MEAIAAGEYHALAALKGGGILVWGAGAGVASPVPVRGLPSQKILAIAAGYQHSLAVVACDVVADVINEKEYL